MRSAGAIASAQLSAGTGGGGGGAYVAKAVHFDGVVSLSLPSYGGPDVPEVSWAAFVKYSSVVPGENYLPFSVGNGNAPNVYPNIAFGAKSLGLALNDQDGDDTLSVDTVTSNPDVQTDTWLCFMGTGDVGHDVGAKVEQLYIGDNVQTLDPARTFDSGTGGNLIINGAAIDIPGIVGGDVFDTALVRVWFGNSIDWSVQANRRKIIDGDGKPVDPATAEAAFGQPAVYPVFDADNNVSNGGTAGALTVVTTRDYFSLGSSGVGSVAIVIPAGTTIDAVHDITNDVDVSASFESVTSVDWQVQQTSSDDLSGSFCRFTFSGGTLTNATTSPSD